jgi:hypothetical protein
VGIKATNIEIQTLMCQSGDITPLDTVMGDSDSRFDGVPRVRQIISEEELDIKVVELRTANGGPPFRVSHLHQQHHQREIHHEVLSSLHSMFTVNLAASRHHHHDVKLE